MFSEITRMRPACARRPEVAIAIERAKPLLSFAMMRFPQLLSMISAQTRSAFVARENRPHTFPDHALPFADRGLEQMQALGIERGRRRVVHLVAGGLHHLLFEI